MRETPVQIPKKTSLKKLWDFVGIPFRMALFDQKWLPFFGWTSLEQERFRAILPHIKGKLLDIGSGPNHLVQAYGYGVGVDVYDWGGGTNVCEDTSNLEFQNGSFDTVTFVACLNHIPNRLEVLREARRVVRPNGRLLITMIDPVLGGIGHSIWWYSEDKVRGGMRSGEVGGIWSKDIISLCKNAGFKLASHKRFLFGLNNLYIFEPSCNTNASDV